MDYQMLVLDLDGTLTNSRKELTEPTKQALIEIQEEGKKVVLASGRPINGIVPLAEKLNLSKYGGSPSMEPGSLSAPQERSSIIVLCLPM